MSLNVLIGLAVVPAVPDVECITPHILATLSLPYGTEQLLLRTVNSELWAAKVTDFRKNYVALIADAARWVVDQGIRLIGVDYLSIARFGGALLTHQVLLVGDVVILAGAEAAPARAVLRRLSWISGQPPSSEGSS